MFSTLFIIGVIVLIAIFFCKKTDKQYLIDENQNNDEPNAPEMFAVISPNVRKARYTTRHHNGTRMAKVVARNGNTLILRRGNGAAFRRQLIAG